jgi:hypothetical protein
MLRSARGPVGMWPGGGFGEVLKFIAARGPKGIGRAGETSLARPACGGGGDRPNPCWGEVIARGADGGIGGGARCFDDGPPGKSVGFGPNWFPGSKASETSFFGAVGI